MFTVIYRFEVIPSHTKGFIELWAELTNDIRKYEGGLGSRLHHQKSNIYIAYAQWPSRETWLKSGDNLPKSSLQTRDKMRNCYSKMTTELEMVVVKDLLN